MTISQSLEYIEEMLEELAKIARDIRCSDLAFVLSMAIMEANQQQALSAAHGEAV